MHGDGKVQNGDSSLLVDVYGAMVSRDGGRHVSIPNSLDFLNLVGTSV